MTWGRPGRRHLRRLGLDLFAYLRDALPPPPRPPADRREGLRLSATRIPFEVIAGSDIRLGVEELPIPDRPTRCACIATALRSLPPCVGARACSRRARRSPGLSPSRHDRPSGRATANPCPLRHWR